MTVASFNALLSWLGVTGCEFRNVVHANNWNNAHSDGYGVAGGTTLDAMRDLKGECRFPF